MADDRRRDASADGGADDSGGGVAGALGAGLRRLLVLIVVVAGVTALCALVLGVLTSSSVARSLSIGFYVVGSFWLVAGFFIGNRGPVRLKSDIGAPLFGSRFVRWATPEEREETINMSAVYVLLGFVLILFGFVADTRYSLF
jgi:hypothetical protein